VGHELPSPVLAAPLGVADGVGVTATLGLDDGLGVAVTAAWCRRLAPWCQGKADELLMAGEKGDLCFAVFAGPEAVESASGVSAVSRV
jgi:hypothetical protein